MQQRTILSIILGVAILSISLFLINSWLNTKNEGMFLTQDTYVGTVTWYEDATTPPVPSELKQSSPLVASAPDTSNITSHSTLSRDVLDIVTANGDDSSSLLEPEIYDVNTGKFVKAPPSTSPPVGQQNKENVQGNSPVIQPQAQPVISPPSSTVKKTAQSVDNTPPPPAKPVRQNIPVQVAQNTVVMKRIFLTKDKKRQLRIETSQPITYKSFYLASPERIVIDIDGRLTTSAIEKSIAKNASIKDVRIAYNGNTTRVVVDLVKKPKNWSVVYGQRKSTIDVALRY